MEPGGFQTYKKLSFLVCNVKSEGFYGTSQNRVYFEDVMVILPFKSF